MEFDYDEHIYITKFATYFICLYDYDTKYNYCGSYYVKQVGNLPN
jgi:hypothetical protein